MLLALGPAFPLQAQKPAARVPTSPGEVIERLPRGYASIEARPSQAAPTIESIEAMLSAAARNGDSRIAYRAEADLARLPAGPYAPRVAKARAYAAQHRHDFGKATALLEDVIRRDGRDAGARLALAQILLVQGDIARAKAQCLTMALGVDAENGALCIAAWALRTGAYGRVRAILDDWLAQSGPRNPARGYALLMRAEAASRAGAPDADRLYREALAAAPGDVAPIAAYARHLRSIGRHRDAVLLLAASPDTDGLRLQLALSAQALRLPQAKGLIASQQRRYALSRSLEQAPEPRDEAELMLATGNALGALSVAEHNFETQRDYEDVLILQRAATAAGQPERLAGLLAWAKSQGLKVDSRDRPR